MIEVIVDFGKSGYKVPAVIGKDGVVWCCLAGENLQEGVAGFGDTPDDAVWSFKHNFRNERTGKCVK